MAMTTTRAGYPERGQNEPLHWYVRFVAYYLPQERADIAAAWRAYEADAPRVERLKEESVEALGSLPPEIAHVYPDACGSDALEHWQKAAAVFGWHRRYEAYYRGVGALPRVRAQDIQTRAHSAYEILSEGLEDAANLVVDAVKAGSIERETASAVSVAKDLLAMFGITMGKPTEFAMSPSTVAFSRAQDRQAKKEVIRMIGKDPDAADLAYRLGMINRRDVRSVEDAEWVDAEDAELAAEVMRERDE